MKLYSTLLALISFGVASGSTYYVSPTGSDTNIGTLLISPFRHLSRAVSAARLPGDTVIALDGIYDNEGVVAPNYVVTLASSGTATAPITIRAQNRGKAILDSMNTATGMACNGASAYFNLFNSSFVIVQGFNIQGACDEGIHSNDAAHDITIRWNEIHHIANHTVTDQYGRSGIYLNKNESNFIFDGNIFHDIGRTDGVSLPHFDHGIYASAKGLTIVNNLFYNMNRGYSIQQSDGAANWTVANNTFVGGIECQIMLWNNSTNIVTRNNIFYNSNIPAITQFAATTSGSFDHNLTLGAVGSTAGLTVASNRVGDPLFASGSTGDYHLMAGSPAIGSGTGGGDLGAFPYTAPPPPPPPPPPSVPVTSATCTAPVAVPLSPGKFTFNCTIITQ